MRPSVQRLLSFLISFILLIAAVLVYGTLIVPSYAGIEQLRNVVAQKEQERKAQEQAVLKLKELLTRFQTLSSARESLALTLPNDPDIPQIVNTLNGLALVNSIDLKNIDTQLLSLQTLSGPSYVKNVGAVRTRFSITGTYENFIKFISQIERNVRIMDVTTLGLSAVGGASGALRSNELNFNITLQAYYQDTDAAKPVTAPRTSKL